jgi:hypothetical protein
MGWRAGTVCGKCCLYMEAILGTKGVSVEHFSEVWNGLDRDSVTNATMIESFPN